MFAALTSNTLPTLYKRIDLAIDVANGTARLEVPGLIDGSSRPIANPVTGAPHRVRVTLPEGFEFTHAEFTAGKAATAGGPIELLFDDTHAHLARIHWTTRGVVH